MKKGVDIGGSFVKVFWEDAKTEKHYVKDIAWDKERFLSRIREIVLEGAPSKVAIGVAGFTSLEGKVYKSPNIKALDGVDLRELFKKEGLEVKVVNDVSAGAFGEWYFENRESRVLLFVAVGTGLGGGLVVDGKPFLGACGSSLEVGHHILVKDGRQCNCGRRGCWEAYCSSYGLERMYFSIAGRHLRDYEIVQRAKEGEAKALKAVEEFKEYLLLGLMNMVHVFNPDVVVLGGGLIEGMKDFLTDMEQRLKGMVEGLPAECLRLRFSTCAEYCVARGALAFTMLDDI